MGEVEGMSEGGDDSRSSEYKVPVSSNVWKIECPFEAAHVKVPSRSYKSFEASC